mmetsp:Transcript_52807/g.138971  ORF Transcript_52807/g.138971 Transcript_52807/m.138971 type:complete len:284 (+) Transcript_52807:1591-2442(+)
MASFSVADASLNSSRRTATTTLSIRIPTIRVYKMKKETAPSVGSATGMSSDVDSSLRIEALPSVPFVALNAGSVESSFGLSGSPNCLRARSDQPSPLPATNVYINPEIVSFRVDSRMIIGATSKLWGGASKLLQSRQMKIRGLTVNIELEKSRRVGSRVPKKLTAMMENVAVSRKKSIDAPESAGKLAAIELMMIRRDVTRLIRRSTRNARMSRIELRSKFENRAKMDTATLKRSTMFQPSTKKFQNQLPYMLRASSSVNAQVKHTSRALKMSSELVDDCHSV